MAPKPEPWKPAPPLPADKAIRFMVCWVNPEHGGKCISGTRMVCPVKECAVEWMSGPYWEIDSRFWTSRAAYESWVLKEKEWVGPNRRDVTNV